MSSRTILDHFSALDDPRQSAKVLYPLNEILLIVLSATLAGAEDFVEMVQWSKTKIAFLRRFLPFAHGIPSHDTLNDVMNALPSDVFIDCFSNWVATLRDDDAEIIAIDGKTSRRAHAKGGKALHLVSAWACRQRFVLGQEPCADKENEITAIPRLLERLELNGALVTIDAMGCQHGIAEKIREAGADYLLALKANQKQIHQEVQMFFDVAKDLDTHTETDGDHGRIETRTVRVCHDVDWLVANRKSPGEPKFGDLTGIAMVESVVEKDRQTTTSRRFYLSSARLGARQIGAAIRAHWGVENRLHWVMDVVFHDDLMRLRTQNGPANMATIRHAALNIIKKIPRKQSLKVRRKSLAWDDGYLEAAIKNTR